MARTKQIGPELKLYDFDTMVYLTPKNVIQNITLLKSFLDNDGGNFAQKANTNMAIALERFSKSYKTSDILSLPSKGQANDTWLRKSGLLDSANGSYDLSPLAKAIMNHEITLAEYSFIMLSKQWIYITDLAPAPKEYKRNLLAFLFELFINNPRISVAAFVQTVNNQALAAYQNQSKTLALSNQDAARFIIEPLLMAEIVQESSGYYELCPNTKYLADEFLNNEILLQKPNVTNLTETFWNDFSYGVYDFSDLTVFETKYPNLFKNRSCLAKNKLPLQQVFYGAPGTGKSHAIDKDTKESNRIRTTFHPDYDYATFVGAYKPTVKQVYKYGMLGKVIMHEDNTPVQEDVIVYKFIPETFINAYVEAWRRYADAKRTDKDFYLVIEEINRGNCAQIFGDLFQLLDRTNVGFSSYAVETESELQNFLTTDEEYKLDIALTEDIKNDNGKVIATAANVMNGKVLVLPPNLHIWATMNTSDQSLFPIDSAFKRRWDWKYVPIKYDNSDWKVMLGDKEVCKWTELQQTLNDLIYDATESEDKMLGDWFVKADGNNEIKEEQLVGKIIFYLWNDVAKVDAGRLFDIEVERNGKKRKVIFSDFYKIDGNVSADVVKAWLKNINVLNDDTTEDENTNEAE